VNVTVVPSASVATAVAASVVEPTGPDSTADVGVTEKALMFDTAEFDCTKPLPTVLLAHTARTATGASVDDGFSATAAT